MNGVHDMGGMQDYGLVVPETDEPWFHQDWERRAFALTLALFALLAGAAFRSTTGALFEPLEHEFGWSRTGTSGAVTANLIFYGLTAPFAAAAMERFGVKRVIITGLTLVALGAGLTTVMTSLWQLWVWWGLFIGIGTGVAPTKRVSDS